MDVKIGDRVRILMCCTGDKKHVGQIGVVTKIWSASNVEVNFNDVYKDHCDCLAWEKLPAEPVDGTPAPPKREVKVGAWIKVHVIPGQPNERVGVMATIKSLFGDDGWLYFEHPETKHSYLLKPADYELLDFEDDADIKYLRTCISANEQASVRHQESIEYIKRLNEANEIKIAARKQELAAALAPKPTLPEIEMEWLVKNRACSGGKEHSAKYASLALMYDDPKTPHGYKRWSWGKICGCSEDIATRLILGDSNVNPYNFAAFTKQLELLKRTAGEVGK